MNRIRANHLRSAVVTATVSLVAASIATTSPALADDVGRTQGFRKAVTVEGVRDHQRALQAIADASGGNRLAGTVGYDRSADYVQSKLEAAGYVVQRHSFTFTLVAERTPSELQQVSPSMVSYVNGVDFTTMTYSGSGDVSAPLWAVDLVLPAEGRPDNSSTSGCESADFAGFPAGAIALLQRGTCSFRLKAENARAAGAVATVVFNEGTSPARRETFNGTLGEPLFSQPAVGTSYALGASLADGVANGGTGKTVRVRTDMIAEPRQTDNLIAETAGGDPDRVVVVGAHLDSVSRGPGINDNGSGSGAILEVAEVLAAREIEPRNKVRFMWFGAEEQGLIGSSRYIAGLSAAERDRIEMMLNFDMIGSPNFARFIYDGDNSAFPVSGGAADGPDGSGEIERVFRDYFASQGLASAETPFNGRSDYGPFIAAGVGIPAGGLFTGAEGVKTAAQAAVFGGTAGLPFDPCYHLGCDTYDNNSTQGLDEMSDAVAHAVLHFARRDFAKDPLVDPPAAPSSGTSGGGGLHDEDHAPVES